jgi:hypothetical protein
MVLTRQKIPGGSTTELSATDAYQWSLPVMPIHGVVASETLMSNHVSKRIRATIAGPKI